MTLSMRLSPLFLAAALGLAGCGNTGDPLFSQTGKALQTAISTPDNPGKLPPLSRNAVVALGHPLLEVTLPARNAQARLIPFGANGDHVTWVSPEMISLTLQRGMLSATRGLGHDLMSVDATQSLALIERQHPGQAQRVHRYLDGERRLFARSFTCEVSIGGPQTVDSLGTGHATTRLNETCRDDQTTFTNTYWRGRDGVIRKSTQWIGPENGYTDLLVLTP